MSTNKKFRVQNGLDVTGEVVVGGITVINADGTVVSDVSDQLVPLQADVSALETAVENIIGTSPETLDTLQEIVAAYEGADADLQLLVAQTNQSVADLQNSVGSGEGLTTPYVSSEITYDENVGSQQYFAAQHTTGHQVAVYDSSDLENYKVVTPPGNNSGSITNISISRTHLIAQNSTSDDVAVWSLDAIFAGNLSPATFRFNSDLNGHSASATLGNFAYAYGTSSSYAKFYRYDLTTGSIQQHQASNQFSGKVKAMEVHGDKMYLVSKDADATAATRLRIYNENGSFSSNILDTTGFTPASGDRETLAVSGSVLALRSNNRQSIKVWDVNNLTNNPTTIYSSSSSDHYFRSVAASDDYLIAIHDTSGEISVYHTSNLSGTPTKITAPNYIESGTNIRDIAVSGRLLYVGSGHPGVIYTYNLDDLSADPVVVVGGSSYLVGNYLDVSPAENLVVTRTENIIPNSGVVPAINYLEDKTNDMQAEINSLSGTDTSLTTSVAANAAAITANTTAISNEVTRATAAEQANTDAIVVEAAARAAADSDLSASISAISSSVNTGDLTVTGSATFESGINVGSNGGSIGYDDTSEDIQMMSDVDMSGNLIHNLGTPVASTDAASKSYVDGRIGDVIGGSVESLDTIKEVVDAFQNADSDIQSLITANSTSVSANTTAIAAETTRAQGVEASLQSQITASVSDTSDLDSDVQANAAAIAVNASNHSTLETFVKGPAPTVSLDTTATQVVPAINELVAAVADTSGITAAFQAADSDVTAAFQAADSNVTAAFQAADASLQAQIDAGAFDGSAIDQNLVPATTDTYSLGTPDKVWKDLYIGPGSLYINGTKILEDNSGTITMYADAGQNLSFGASGGGSIDLNAGDESIQIKSDLVLSVGETISTVGGAATQFGGSVNMQTHKIENVGAPTADLDVATKLYVDTLVAAGTFSGDRTFDANVVVEGNLTVSGTTTTVNSETILLADNIIDLNSNLTSGAPTEHAGIRVLRGDESAVQVRWNETSDHWEVYNGSAWTKIALDTDDLAEGSTNLYFTEARARGCVSADDNSCIDYNEATGKFSLDVAETEAAITPDSAKDADKLDGQHGSYYRINVYDANGTLVN